MFPRKILKFLAKVVLFTAKSLQLEEYMQKKVKFDG